MEKLQEELRQYPSSFSVKESMPVKTDIKIIKEKLLQELKAENEYDTDMERHRTWNLISFSCFVLGNLEDAKRLNQKVLDSDNRNIIALSNKAWFSLEEDNIKQCKDIMKQLKRHSKDTMTSLIAKAEIAFTCSRFGKCKYDKAVSLYQKVAEECCDLKNKKYKPNIPVEHICIWIFGYALIKRRQLNKNNIMDESLLDISHNNQRDTAELYCQIIRLEGSSTCLKRYRARSFVDLGFLVYDIRKNPYSDISSDDIEEIIPKDQIRETEDYFKEALDIFRTDSYVLERCGQYFRYRGRSDLAIMFLEEAVEIKGSSFAYHHLALALKRKLEYDKNSTFELYETPLSEYEHQTSKRLKRKLIDERQTTNSKRESGNKKARKDNHYYSEKNKQRLIEGQNARLSGVLKRPGQLTTLLNMIKPKYIKYEKNKDSIDRIMMYLDNACTVSTNPSAMNDKGLLYRQIGKPERAFEIFKVVFKNKDGHSSRVQIANAYEQAAFCKIELEGNSMDRDTKDTVKMYLKSSLEISCNLVRKIPNLNTCWKSAPTLKTLLSGEARTKETLQDLLDLQEKTQTYKEAIEILAELEEIATSDEEKAELIQQKIKHHLHLGNYDDAVIALDVIACLPDENQMVRKRIYRKVQIEAGIDRLRRGDAEMARQRIKKAFDDSGRNDTSSGDDGDILKDEYDLFILCNTDDDDNGMKLMNIMNQTGLCTTVNVESERPGTPVTTGMRDVMNHSKQFAVLLDFDFEIADIFIQNQMQVFADMLLQIVQKYSTKTVLLVLTGTTAKVPDIFSHFKYKRIYMDLCAVDKEEEDFFQNDNILESVKHILLSLAAVS